MEKTVSLETALNSRTTYAMPGTARHFGVFDPAGGVVDRSTVEGIAREGLKAAQLFGSGPGVYFSKSGGCQNIEAGLPVGCATRVFRRFGYRNYFTLGAFVQGAGIFCAALPRPLAACVIGWFKPYPPGRQRLSLSLTRVVLRLGVGRAQKSYSEGTKDADYHTSRLPNGWLSGNLPDPRLEGKTSLSDVLHRVENKSRGSIKRINGIKRGWKKADIGQILWAGYGSTPHWTHRALEKRGGKKHGKISRYCHQGKTVPSWNAEYGLEIYASFEGGVYRYASWDGRAAAPTHSLLDVDDAAVEKAIRGMGGGEGSARIFILERDAGMPGYARWIEAGCSALNMVLQANALGLDVGASAVGKGRVLALVDVG